MEGSISKPRVVFWTFGGGGQPYRDAAHRLCKQARQMGVFDQVVCYTDTKLRREFPDLVKRHRDLIASSRRGWGYWFWKPFLAYKMLQSVNEGDMIVYLDAGCELNLRGKPKMRQYIARAFEDGSLFFHLTAKRTEERYCKMDTLHYFGIDTNDILRKSAQIESGTWFMVKSPKILKLTQDWMRVHGVENYHHVTDARSKLPNAPGFQGHRHDQSILSLLIKLDGTHTVLPDIRFFRNWRCAEAQQQPILTMRNCTGRSKIP